MAANDIVLYLRVSTTKQDYDRQKQDLEKWCNGKYYIVRIFEDKLSGFDNEREGLESMKQYLIDNNIKNVAVWEFSRLSRDKIELQKLCKWFEKHQIQVFFYEQGFFLLDGKNKINDQVDWTITILSKLVETEAATIKDRMSSGRTNAKKQGRYTGGIIPVGYRKDNDTKMFLIDNTPHNDVMTVSDCVVWVFNRYAEGDISIADLARECLFKKFPSQLTNIPSIRSILKNKLYTGEKNNQKVPQIISVELFDKVQATMVAKCSSDAERRKKHRYFCKGLVKCPYCINPRTNLPVNFIGLAGSGQYMCYTNRTGSKIVRGTNICKSAQINNSHLDSIIWDITKQYIINNEELFEFDKSENEIKINELNTKISACEEQVEILNKQKKKLSKIYMNDGLTDAEFDKQMKEINKKIKSFQNEISISNELIVKLSKQVEEEETVQFQIARLIRNVNDITDEETVVSLINQSIKYVKIYNADTKFQKVIEFQYTQSDYIYYILWKATKKSYTYILVDFTKKYKTDVERQFIFDEATKTFKSDNTIITYEQMYSTIFTEKPYEMIYESFRKKGRNKPHSQYTIDERERRNAYMREFRKRKTEERKMLKNLNKNLNV
ncbi:recombinase family protein [Parabacteroides sp. OttesenSCG-928-J18]|nr:recombinase family protein [Parabacteroides sp. OttesenSCG-928-J18]